MRRQRMNNVNPKNLEISILYAICSKKRYILYLAKNSK